jgi:hypothetical protein
VAWVLNGRLSGYEFWKEDKYWHEKLEVIKKISDKKPRPLKEFLCEDSYFYYSSHNLWLSGRTVSTFHGILLSLPSGFQNLVIKFSLKS